MGELRNSQLDECLGFSCIFSSHGALPSLGLHLLLFIVVMLSLIVSLSTSYIDIFLRNYLWYLCYKQGLHSTLMVELLNLVLVSRPLTLSRSQVWNSGDFSLVLTSIVLQGQQTTTPTLHHCIHNSAFQVWVLFNILISNPRYFVHLRKIREKRQNHTTTLRHRTFSWSRRVPQMLIYPLSIVEGILTHNARLRQSNHIFFQQLHLHKLISNMKPTPTLQNFSNIDTYHSQNPYSYSPPIKLPKYHLKLFASLSQSTKPTLLILTLYTLPLLTKPLLYKPKLQNIATTHNIFSQTIHPISPMLNTYLSTVT